MITPERLYELLFANLKKLFYPEEWINLDLSFSKSELLTMLLVEKQEEVIMSEIADYINLPMSTATGIVERLVKSNYLTRERSDSDRRIVVVSLSQEGKFLVSELKELIFSYFRAASAALSADEQEFLVSIFTKIIQALKNVNRTEEQEEPKKQAVKKIEID